MEAINTSLDISRSELLSAIAQALPVPLFVIDAEGRYLAVLGAVDHAEHHDPSPLLGRRMHDVLPRTLADRFIAEIAVTLARNVTRIVEYRVPASALDPHPDSRGPSGDQWYEARVCPAPHFKLGKPVVITIVSNITERVKTRQLLEQLADTDPLTSLLNRRAFIDRARELMVEARANNAPVSLAILDIDDFKSVNDRHGHAAGDEVLLRVAHDLKGGLRTSDLIGRLGGEEFVILLPGADRDSAFAILEKLRYTIATHACDQSRACSVTVSAGVAELGADSDVKTAMKRADAALYAAKRTGKNRVIAQPVTPVSLD